MTATTNLAAASGATFQLAGVIILGDTDLTLYDQIFLAGRSPLMLRPYAEEERLCQRYFERVGNGQADSLLVRGYQAAGANLSVLLSLKAVKRVLPATIQVGTWTVSNCAQPTAVGFIDVLSIYSSATTTGDMYFTPGAGAYITLNARM